jgi:hypothetical protein
MNWANTKVSFTLPAVRTSSPAATDVAGPVTVLKEVEHG